MKKLVFTAAFALFFAPVFSQTYFSCNYREYCDWLSDIEKFETECDGYDENSMFIINDEETMFEHKTPDMTSAYYVQEKEYDSENDVYIWDVVSDVGNEYMYVFDINNDEIRVLITKDDGSMKMLRFYVKKSWTTE